MKIPSATMTSPSHLSEAAVREVIFEGAQGLAFYGSKLREVSFWGMQNGLIGQLFYLLSK